MAGDTDALATGRVPPGLITADHASINQLLASGINFDRAGFAYDLTSYTNLGVRGTSTSPLTWSRVGGTSGQLRVPLGNLDEPVYVWIWGFFSWAAADSVDGRVCAVLFDDLDTSAAGLVRSSNVSNDRVTSDGFFRQFVYFGFMAIDEHVLRDLTTGVGDWNIGMEHQVAGAQINGCSVSRQSLIVFVSAFPPDGSKNYTEGDSIV